VTERPQTLVREPVVVAVFLLGGEPDATQRVFGLIGRHAQTIAAVHGRPVGVARAVRDPGAVARPQHRLERGDQAAGRHQGFDAAAATHVHIRLAVRDDKQPAVLDSAPDMGSQPFAGPPRLGRLAQAGFLLGGGARGFEALHQVRDLVDERLEEIAFRQRRLVHPPEPDLLQPGRGAGQRLEKTPPHQQQRDRHDRADLDEQADEPAAPQFGAGGADVGRLVEDRETSQQPAVLAEGLDVSQDRGVARPDKLSAADAASGLRQRARPLDQRAGQRRRRHDRQAVRVVDRDAGCL
jgi:hypothetical protein